MKKIIQTTFIIIFFQNIISAQINYYKIEQIKDTLIKYKNPFKAFDKLDLYKISINEFRKDSFLVSKAIKLLDVKYFREYVFLRNTNEDLKYLEKFDWERRSKIQRYLKNVRKIPIKKLDIFYDSIAQNPVLLKKYVDTVYFSKRKADSLNYLKYNWKTMPHKYITFHSKLMTQTGYDTIRSYYNRYYKNFNEDKYFGGGKYDAVIIALINMGDPEIRAKYDAWFDKKLKKQEIRLNEYLFLTKYVNGSLKYKELAKLLFYSKKEVFDSEGYMKPFNAIVVLWNFPFIDTLSYKENLKIKENMRGKFTDFIKIDKKGNTIYKYKSTYEEFYKYYMDYVAYLEKKEKVLFNKIKYKTEK